MRKLKDESFFPRPWTLIGARKILKNLGLYNHEKIIRAIKIIDAQREIPISDKKMLEKASCHLSSHVWGDWEYVADNSCEQRNECHRCQRYRTRVQHADMITDDSEINPCRNGKLCPRCGFVEERFSHLWSKWQLSSHEGYCERKCARCYSVECQLHDYETWEKSDGQGVSGGGHCVRCGHDMGDWSAMHIV